jgi:RNA polymerase sigma-70 factor (sigma-E family)
MDSSASSFEVFVRAHAGGLLRTATLITWDDAEAEDLVQECLLKVARHWRRVRVMEMPLAYARRVLINLALAGRDRRSRRRDELGESQPGGLSDSVWSRLVDPNAEAAMDALGDRAELLAALGQLTQHQRAVLALRYYNDLSEAQVAGLLGCSVGAVKKSAFRGVAHLRRLMADPASTTEVCEP